jgi:hypothetical protein
MADLGSRAGSAVTDTIEYSSGTGYRRIHGELAASPPARQARRHWYTDFVLTRKILAIRRASMSCSSSRAACSRTSSRRARPSAVSPPPSALQAALIMACTATWAVLAWHAIRHPKTGHGTFDRARLRKIGKIGVARR